MEIPTPLIGCTVARTAVDHQVRISFSGPDPAAGHHVDAELVVRTPFLLADATGEWHELDPGTGAGPALLDLVRRTVGTVEICGRGALHLTFDNGMELHVGPDADHVSWHLGGTGVAAVTVGPGGETDWRPYVHRERPTRVELDGTSLHTERDVHRALAGLLDFGPYYGHNLDALWDWLTTDVERPVHLVWHDAQRSRRQVGSGVFGRIVDVLDAVAARDRGRTQRFTYELR